MSRARLYARGGIVAIVMRLRSCPWGQAEKRMAAGERPADGLGDVAAVELLGPVLEGRDHAPDGLVEEHADHLLQQRRFELEIDEEIDPRPVLAFGDELPV